MGKLGSRFISRRKTALSDCLRSSVFLLTFFSASQTVHAVPIELEPDAKTIFPKQELFVDEATGCHYKRMIVSVSAGALVDKIGQQHPNFLSLQLNQQASVVSEALATVLAPLEKSKDIQPLLFSRRILGKLFIATIEADKEIASALRLNAGISVLPDCIYKSSTVPTYKFQGRIKLAAATNAPAIAVTNFNSSWLTTKVNSLAQNFFFGTSLALQVAPGDFNGDGLNDLWVQSLAARTILSNAFSSEFHFEDTMSGLEPAANGVVLWPRISDLQAMDIEHSGITDRLAAVYRYDACSSITGTCSVGSDLGVERVRSDIVDEQRYPLGVHPIFSLPGDLNADGYSDFIGLGAVDAASGLSSATVFINDGTGHFNQTQSLALPPGVGSATLADYDHDGFLDLVYSKQSGEVFFQSNLHSGLIDTTSSQIFQAQLIYDTQTADLNSDGYDDLVISQNDGVIKIATRDPAGGFSAPISISVGANPSNSSFATGDVDADGDIDILVSNAQGSSVQVINNTLVGGSYGFALDSTPLFSNGTISQPQRSYLVNNAALAGVKIELTSLSNSAEKYSTISDSSGAYLFSQVPAGSYAVTFSKNNYTFVPYGQADAVPLTVTIGADTQQSYSLRHSVGNIPAISAAISNDLYSPLQWALYNEGQTGGQAHIDIDAVRAWSITQGDAQVVVGVIDSGIDVTHPDLQSNVWTNSAEIPANGIDDEHDGVIDDVHGYNSALRNNAIEDRNGHGTHVAGIIAAVKSNTVGISGVAPGVKVMAIRADEYGPFSDSSLSEAVAYAVYQKQHGVNLRVLNMSLGGDGSVCSPNLQSAMQVARDNGILFVIGSGNMAASYPSFPANCPLNNVIAVAASDASGNLASFSNYGAQTVDLAAPGKDIVSLFPNHGYQVLSGTSMSTPMVSGVAALLVSRFPNETPVQIKNRILLGVTPLAGLSGKVITEGILNAYKSLSISKSVDSLFSLSSAKVKTGSLNRGKTVSISASINVTKLFTLLPNPVVNVKFRVATNKFTANSACKVTGNSAAQVTFKCIASFPKKKFAKVGKVEALFTASDQEGTTIQVKAKPIKIKK
ncbi:MAG: S8 family serine peptidase [Oligoflexia bacterium]|nr:S8 family serine peptidase [Oligoflexia bacterium]